MRIRLAKRPPIRKTDFLVRIDGLLWACVHGLGSAYRPAKLAQEWFHSYVATSRVSRSFSLKRHQVQTYIGAGLLCGLLITACSGSTNNAVIQTVPPVGAKP